MIVEVVLTQAALHLGPLAVSQPFMVIVNPFVSLVLGIWLYGEHFEGGAWKVAVGAVGFVTMMAGVVFLAGRRLLWRPRRPSRHRPTVR